MNPIPVNPQLILSVYNNLVKRSLPLEYLTIVGVRNDNRTAGSFDDLIILLEHLAEPVSSWLCFRATTDPGTTYMNNPVRQEGCFIIAEGYHKDLWKYGTHGVTGKNPRPALVQHATVRGYRDNGRDGIIDFTNPVAGQFAVNLHDTVNSPLVNTLASAGCQVIFSKKNFAEYFLPSVGNAEQNFGQIYFSYILFTLESGREWSLDAYPLSVTGESVDDGSLSWKLNFESKTFYIRKL
jgi:hypothetical protein